MRVCLFIEGSYPYVTGGVSSWVHELIQGLPDIEFSLLTISPSENQKLQYTFPENVIEHKDYVISERQKIKTSPKNEKHFFKELLKMHSQMAEPFESLLEKFFSMIPEGYFLYEDAVKNPDAWEYITQKNQMHNPAYSFSDYFWAWKSSHDMMFTVIGTAPPKADVYHAVSTGYAGLSASVASFRTKTPMIVTEHGLYHKERDMEIKRSTFVRGYQRDLWIGLYNSISKICYIAASKIISLFEQNRRKQVELGASPEKTLVVPNGINIEYFSKVERVKKPGFHIGLVGRVVPIKDVKTFIAAAKIISERIPDTRFYVVGPTDEDEAYFDDCQKLVSSFNLEKIFEFTGKQEVLKYYSFFDVVMLTSIREAQPLVILEAFCCGIPFVSTKVGNVQELLDYDEHFYASSKDPEKLAAAVEYIHSHPAEMKTIVAKNREIVYKLYNRTTVHNKYAELYAEVLQNKNSGNTAEGKS